jgi:hypothetical protein
MIKRLDRLDVATLELASASATYARNFGFTVQHASGTDDATITIGDAEVRLRVGTSVADVIASSGEGLAAIWLEAEDVDEIATALENTGIAFGRVPSADSCRVLALDATAANMVPLFIFDRRG